MYFDPEDPRRRTVNALAQLSGPAPAMPAAAGSAPGGMRQGYYDYLKANGYTGGMGPDMHAYAQQLRASGQHPWLDYWHQANPNPSAGGYDGSGINPGAPRANWQPGMAYNPPHRMPPPTVLPMRPQVAGQPNALASLGRRPVPVAR